MEYEVDVTPDSSKTIDGFFEECNLCFNQVEIDGIVYLKDCYHVICTLCLQNYLDQTPMDLLLDKDTSYPVCPFCKASKKLTLIQPNLIEHLAQNYLLSQQTADMINKQMILNMVGKFKETKYSCANPQCNFSWFLHEDSKKKRIYDVYCYKCYCHQCCKCGMEWQKHLNNHKCLKDQQDEGIDQDVLQIRKKERTIKCPGACGQYYGKSQGCNVIVCPKCQIKICILCGEKLPDIYSHDHYKQGPQQCRGCDRVNVERWHKTKERKERQEDRKQKCQLRKQEKQKQKQTKEQQKQEQKKKQSIDYIYQSDFTTSDII